MRDLFGELINEPDETPAKAKFEPLRMYRMQYLVAPRPYQVIRLNAKEVLIWHDPETPPPPQPKADFLFG